jgi:lipopolysaccharide/colanic/teichoic acid biosynthesis glycosyltransferase
LFPLIALLIKLTSKGPVFFKQLRSGENSEAFYCYKFRTMKVNDQCDEMQATKDDPRITKIGAFLRKTNLDEMPQFLNVFLGSMSVIGPRPHMLKHTESYSEQIDDFMVRHFIKPGITGWAQVNGFRGETKEVGDMENRVKHDIWYIENWNFLLDFKILFLTIYRMTFGDPNAF